MLIFSLYHNFLLIETVNTGNEPVKKNLKYYK